METLTGIINAVCGDIIGSKYERFRTKDYNFPLVSSGVAFTDDTVHTCAVADWLMNTARTDYELTEKLVEWSSRYNVGYGTMFRDWIDNPEHKPYGSFGNGSAMRVSPVAWVAKTEEECLELALQTASVTHNHIEGIKGAQAVAFAIWMNRQNKYSKDEIKYVISTLFNYDLDRPYEEIKKTYKFDATCQGSVPESIICWLQSTDYIDCIRKAVSLGGDADTMACIAGSICGAKKETSIPKEIYDLIVNYNAFLYGGNDILNVVNNFTAKYC